MKSTRKYAIYNIIVGTIFTLLFGAIGIYGGISLGGSTSTFALTNAIFILIIGILGVADGVKTFVKGFSFISRDTQDVPKADQDNKSSIDT